jgi:signal transduction histidine kinase
MASTLRTKLLAILCAAALGFLGTFVVTQVAAWRVEQRLVSIEDHDVPRLELGLRLAQSFERIQRDFLDAAAGHDVVALHNAPSGREDYEAELRRGAPLLTPAETADLQAAFDAWWRRASDVARRISEGETGEAVLAEMARVQEAQQQIRVVIRRISSVDRRLLATRLEEARAAQIDARRLNLLTTGLSLTLMLVLSMTLGRSILRSVNELTAGFARFGRGEFLPPIEVHGDDELARVSREANRMAESLQALAGQREQALQRVAEKARELEQMALYKSQFLANTSHELRTPLNSMLLLSGVLAENEGGRLTEREVGFARTIHAAGKELLALIDQVLDLARIEAGRLALQLGPVALAEVAGRAERVFSPLARERGLLFRVDLGSEAPESIETDRQRLDQILTNLLGNAIKFTTRGEVALRIHSGGGWVSFAVSDTGVGIAAADQERIFAPFEQVDGNVSRKHGGTGLGLTIARELAQLLGGELRVASEPGRGSTFTCVLPLRAPWHAGTARRRVPANPEPG